MKIHRDICQGSVDWLLLRAGKVTASEMDALISPLGKIREGDGVHTYLTQKLVELWTGGPLPQLQGIFDVEQGQFLEERAKPAFTLHTGLEIENAAFISTEDEACGCSPDALIPGCETGVEIKCPTMPTHVGYLLAGVLPKTYVAQVQGSMFVTGFKQWHFFSYNRQFPPLHLVVERDEKFQVALAAAVENFLAQIDTGYQRLVSLNGGPPPPRPKLTPPKETEEGEVAP